MRRVVAATFAAVAVLVAVGNWERSDRADEQSDGIRRVLAAVGPLDDDTLRGFRILVNFQCLVYERGRNDFALEVCVDADGRVVEAIDRRDGVRIWSLRDDRSRSSVRVDRSVVNALLRKMNVPESYLPDPPRGSS